MAFTTYGGESDVGLTRSRIVACFADRTNPKLGRTGHYRMQVTGLWFVNYYVSPDSAIREASHQFRVTASGTNDVSTVLVAASWQYYVVRRKLPNCFREASLYRSTQSRPIIIDTFILF